MSTAEPMPMEPLMTGQEVADFLKISLSGVYALRRQGKLPGIPIGSLWRFAPEVVRAYSRGEPVGQPSVAPVVPIGGRRKE